jgi:transposase
MGARGNHFPSICGGRRVAGVREAIEAAGARLRCLPPCLPDFNLIENMWSKIKQASRSLYPHTQTDCPAAFLIQFVPPCFASGGDAAASP